ncbi:MAG: ImmA/IrrE family metallo-endopeptidase [Candidatus Omnitrophica bacterium]|nr:ImmA/IrrE family metallo-endopeptidase [Candidatus Omnitrophota bacterium]
MSAGLEINPQIIEWAIKKYSLNLDKISKSAGVKKETILSWLKKDKFPTYNQIKKLACALYIPQGYLFLSNPPRSEQILPDFRTVGSSGIDNYSQEFRDVIHSTFNKKCWLREHLINMGKKPLQFLGEFNKDSQVNDVAASISEILGIDDDLRETASNYGKFIKLAVDRCEENGITVLRRGHPRDFNKRELKVDEFRGFAVYDEYAPFIFINSKDSKAAQIFTLFHELAHIWIQEEGISNINLEEGVKHGGRIEKLCNAIAAEVLTPTLKFTEAWDGSLCLDENLQVLSTIFKVSSLVVLRKAYDLKFINGNAFRKKYAECIEKYKEIEKKKSDYRGKKRGFSFKNTFLAQNGRMFSRYVVNAALNGEILYRDAAKLLDKKNTSIIDKVSDLFNAEW